MMRKCVWIFIWVFILLVPAKNANARNIEIVIPDLIISNVETEFLIQTKEAHSVHTENILVTINGNKVVPFEKTDTGLSFRYKFKSSATIKVIGPSVEIISHKKVLPLWLSIIPPLIAILLALLFKEVFTALIIGILTGSILIIYFKGTGFLLSIPVGIFTFIDTFLIDALSDSGHLSIIIFSLLIGAMVVLISKNGGMQGVVNVLSKYANSSRSGQFVTWLLGLAIFFDDYANTLVVGNTMRPVTDRLRISREKLSYIVDSTAAPIAAIAFVTTWIGAELGYIDDGIAKIGLNLSAYTVFFNSIAYSYYPILALIFIAFLIYQQKDYGPMLRAELKARKDEQIIREDDHNPGYGNLGASNSIVPRWYNAVIPIFMVISITISGLLITGLESANWEIDISFTKNLSIVIGAADSYKALLWGSITGVITALLLTLIQKIISLKESVEALVSGIKTMMTAILILVLAWCLASITEHMHTADFITRVLIDFNATPFIIPAITFVISSLIAFSTGSSWGTMAILYPIILPASWYISQQHGLDEEASLRIFYNVVSTVLAGSVLGDHCSPISDTTILSSLASSCDHIAHVKTQLPYAITVGSVSVIFGTIPSAYGIPGYVLFPLNLLILFLIIKYIGKSSA